ncbi:EH domain-containing protein 1-like [Trichosurus vulpecula]|uniref:EH domain-containing protein 1-like n=1 Tax=Trichosurus vulpecula TaxID=9337 RepID=UPI00186AC90F|nr:EH domain-containing protein 1-like [Trichosurus vulpecula]
MAAHHLLRKVVTSEAQQQTELGDCGHGPNPVPFSAQTAPRRTTTMSSKGKGADRRKSYLFMSVAQRLGQLYVEKLLPLEETYHFARYHSPSLLEADFDNKPMVLLMGQYSTGKTTFISYLLEQEFPCMRIGPEPTTDGFIVLTHGDVENVMPGNVAVVDRRFPFRNLTNFGNAFLNRFVCVQLPNEVLESISIIDTPGILAGEKQRVSRGYDFSAVLQWFAERVDLIIMLFDAHKLDISDELSQAIKALKNYEDKMRVVLNKSDQIGTQQLMRVYGALMWSLGKIINTPEVMRVYIGSFWSNPFMNTENSRLFEAEALDLFRDIQKLPHYTTIRKMNDLIKRARLARVHGYIISTLKREMPMFGKENKKRELLTNLKAVYQKIEREYHVSPGDFPSIPKMQELLQTQDFSKFQTMKPKLFENLEQMLSKDIARLMFMIKEEEAAAAAAAAAAAQAAAIVEEASGALTMPTVTL